MIIHTKSVIHIANAKFYCYNCSGKDFEIEVSVLKVSFKKLFKLLIDRDMKKNELAAAADLSANTIAKLAKNENVSLDVLIRICTALNVDFGDIMELVPDSE